MVVKDSVEGQHGVPKTWSRISPWRHSLFIPKHVACHGNITRYWHTQIGSTIDFLCCYLIKLSYDEQFCLDVCPRLRFD